MQAAAPGRDPKPFEGHMTHINAQDTGPIELRSPARRNVLTGMATGMALGILPGTSALAQTSRASSAAHIGKPRPRFADKIEEFPLKLPAGKQIGTAVSLALAPNGDVFILQHFEGAVWVPPVDARLPPVVHVSSDGQFINAWGGPDQLPAANGVSQWPSGCDNIERDPEGNIWVFGYARDDNAAAKFTSAGKFLMRIGERGKAGDDDDTQYMNGPVSCYLDVANREVFIADGYRNHRVIAFNADTGKFTRMWGAYGKKPSSFPAVSSCPKPTDYGNTAKAHSSGANPPKPDFLWPPPPPRHDVGFGNPVHKITCASDGRLYVCDRTGNRVQEFEQGSGEIRFLREVVIAPGTRLMGSAWDVVVSPDGKYLYVADGMCQRIWSVDRATFEVLGWTNATPATEGDDNVSTQMHALHRIGILPNGDVLMAMTNKGIQRLRYLGVR
jgi:hypothetical protein